MCRRVIHERFCFGNIFQYIIDLKAQVAEELADQAAADEKYGVVFAVGCGGAGELCHSSSLSRIVHSSS
jgi:hypothetical protein